MVRGLRKSDRIPISRPEHLLGTVMFYPTPASQQLLWKVNAGGEIVLDMTGNGILAHEQRFVLGFGMGRVAREHTETDC